MNHPTDDALDELRHHWGEAYSIHRTPYGVWIAVRRDTRETLRAETSEDLFDAIRADYAERPVPRQP